MHSAQQYDEQLAEQLTAVVPRSSLTRTGIQVQLSLEYPFGPVGRET